MTKMKKIKTKHINKWVGECLRKTKLLEDYADKIIKQAKSEGTVLYKYSCPHCFNWHVTKKKRKDE